MQTCPECHAIYRGGDRSGGHCRGGAYGGCCQTFANNGTADAHFVMPWENLRCLCGHEMYIRGWRFTEKGWNMFPALTEEEAVRIWGK